MMIHISDYKMINAVIIFINDFYLCKDWRYSTTS